MSQAGSSTSSTNGKDSTDSTGRDGDAEGLARTYRAEVIGQFDRPTGGVRDLLLARQPDHDVFASAFTEAGCLTYGPTLTRFTVRYLLSITAPSSVVADAEAAASAELRAMERLEADGVPYRDLTVSLTCLEDLKPRR